MDKALFDSVVTSLTQARDKDGLPLNMDSIIVSQDDRVFRHDFSAEDGPIDTRSISKTVVAMAIGIAIEQGVKFGSIRLSEDTLIWPFLNGKAHVTKTSNLERLRKIKLRHLLNLTMGYDSGLLFSKDLKGMDQNQLLEYLLNYDLSHDPGEHFVYTNAGHYIFSAIVQEILGVDLAQWVAELLFSKIGIRDFEWKKYGRYCIGSSGLMLRNRDLHVLGQILVNQGEHDGKQIVPKDWVQLMRSPMTLTPSMYDPSRVFPKYAYGYGLWVCQNGNYYVDGTDGQYLIVIPRRRIVITTLGHQGDMKPITKCLTSLL